MTVTLVTHDATLDDLSTGDYRDMYIEARRLEVEGEKPISYDRFIAMCGSRLSKAQWAKYDSGEIGLTRQMRNDLRRLFSRPELPPTVAEATAAASPDAAVWLVGEGVPEHVIMVGDKPVTLYVNGSVQTVAPKSHVTEVTGARRTRKRTKRMWVSIAHQKRLAALVDVSDSEVIEAGLKHFERMLRGHA